MSHLRRFFQKILAHANVITSSFVAVADTLAPLSKFGTMFGSQVSGKNITSLLCYRRVSKFFAFLSNSYKMKACFHKLYFCLVCILKSKYKVKLLQSKQIHVSTLVKLFLCCIRVSREIRDYSTEKSCFLINRNAL